MTAAPLDALDELAGWPNWLYWRLEPPRTPGSKPVKMPYCPATGQHASTTDPRTWSTFDATLAACQERHGRGIGFVFSANDPYCGVDLDACIDRETGVVAAWATTIVEALASYTEFSPSDTGLHVIVRAALPSGGNRRGAVELYDSARYFTMTGRAYPGSPLGIARAQKAVSALHRELFGDGVAMETRRPVARTPVEPSDAALLARMFGARNGDRVRRLWDGDTSRYYDPTLGHDDRSRADLALVAHLRFWTGGDQARADRLFRQSALYREKWDGRRGKTTYGARTLARAGAQQRMERGPIEL